MSEEIARRSVVRGLLAALAVALAGCGRKGSPEPPPDSIHPRKYLSS